MKFKKLGIIGFGEMGKRHALEFEEATHGYVKAVGVVEPDDRKYREGCEWLHREIPRFLTIEELLQNGKPDGVIISSPNSMHWEHLRHFTGKDIPILLEKPLDSTHGKILEIVRFAADYQGIIMVDHVMRYTPIISEAKALIDAGKLGRICSFNFVQHNDCGALFHTFRRSRTGGGGHMLEKATHDLDIALFLTGSVPERVAMISRQQKYGGNRDNHLHCSECPELMTCDSAQHSAGAFGPKDITVSNDLCVFAKAVDVADNEAALIQCSNGVFGTYSQCYFTRIHGRSRCYEIVGLEGALFLEMATDTRHGRLTFSPRSSDGHREEHCFDYFGKIHYNGGAYMARHFYEIMTGEATTPFTTVNQAFLAEVLALAAMASAESGRFVEISEMIPEDLRELLV